MRTHRKAEPQRQARPDPFEEGVQQERGTPRPQGGGQTANRRREPNQKPRPPKAPRALQGWRAPDLIAWGETTSRGDRHAPDAVQIQPPTEPQTNHEGARTPLTKSRGRRQCASQLWGSLRQRGWRTRSATPAASPSTNRRSRRRFLQSRSSVARTRNEPGFSTSAHVAATTRAQRQLPADDAPIALKNNPNAARRLPPSIELGGWLNSRLPSILLTDATHETKAPRLP
jgi:hypothetical protein